jgi:hypothetical protein
MRLTTFQCISYATPRHALLCHHSTKHYHALAEHILTSLCHCGAVRYPSLLYRYNTSYRSAITFTARDCASPYLAIATQYFTLPSLHFAVPFRHFAHTSQCKSILCFSPLNNTLAVPRLALPCLYSTTLYSSIAIQHQAFAIHGDSEPILYLTSSHVNEPLPELRHCNMPL